MMRQIVCTALTRNHPLVRPPLFLGQTSPASQRLSPASGGSPSAVFQQSGVDPALIQIEASRSVPMRDLVTAKADILARLLINHQIALNNRERARIFPQLANPTGNYYVAEAIYCNGQSSKGVNLEAGPRTTMCAEQSALANIQTQQRTAPISARDVTSMPQLKWLLVSTTRPGQTIDPCQQCLDWLRHEPQATVVTLRRNAQGRLVLYAQAVRDMLPLAGETTASMALEPIHRLPVIYSPKAYQVMQRRNIRLPQLKHLMTEAQRRYKQVNTTTSPDQTNQAAAVMVNGEVYTANTMQWWSRRMVEDPDVLAATHGIQHMLAWQSACAAYYGKNPGAWWMLSQVQRPRVDAIAYYGEDSNYPKPSSLGKLMHPHWGGRDILVLTVRKNTLYVHTAQDYVNTTYFKSR